MNSIYMRRWLISQGSLNWRELNITESEMEGIRGRNVTFKYNGEQLYFKKEEIESYLETKCSKCREYQQRLQLLENQLGDIPNLDLLIRDYINQNFIKILKRNYPRRQLRIELDAYLEDYNVCVTDKAWNNLIVTYLGDTSLYRKLKIKKIDTLIE